MSWQAGVAELSTHEIDHRRSVHLGVSVHARRDGVVELGWLGDDAQVVLSLETDAGDGTHEPERADKTVMGA